MPRSQNKIDTVRPSINVTPLVDVCLVLLIIFMVVTDQLSQGKAVTLPRTVNHATARDAGRRIVSVTRDGTGVRLWWDRDPLRGADELKSRLALDPAHDGGHVFVKADADLRYGDVYPVLAALRESGAAGAELATQELHQR